MKNGRFTQCLVVDCDGRTNLVSSSTQSLEDLRGPTQIGRFTDNSIVERDQRVGRKHDGVGARLCDSHSFSNGVPERDFAQCKGLLNFSVTRGEAISNSNPASDSNVARLGELDASTNEGTTHYCRGGRPRCNRLDFR